MDGKLLALLNLLFFFLLLPVNGNINGAMDHKDMLLRLVQSHEPSSSSPSKNLETGSGQTPRSVSSSSSPHMHMHQHQHHMMNPNSVIVFFLIDDLEIGNTLPIYFPTKQTDPSLHFLSEQEADSIPFSLEQHDNLRQLFSFPRDSTQSTAMRETLKSCQAEPIKGELKLCATSFESLLDFIGTIFGSESRIRILHTRHDRRAGNDETELQKYAVKGVRPIPAEKLVACHTMPYPYAVFYCHSQNSESRVFSVSLIGENGDGVEAVAVCHMDTSEWSPEHVAFRVLGVQPGSSPVCHFFPADNFVWVPSGDAVDSAI